MVINHKCDDNRIMEVEFMLLKKQNLLIVGLAVVLVVAGYLNFSFRKNNDAEGDVLFQDRSEAMETESDDVKMTSTASDDEIEVVEAGSRAYFVDYRFERESVRNQELKWLKDIADDEDAGQNERDEARSKIMSLTDKMELEMILENLIKAKGFKDAAVMIHDKSINVVVDKQRLKPEEAARILDIIESETNLSANDVKITPKS